MRNELHYYYIQYSILNLDDPNIISEIKKDVRS